MKTLDMATVFAMAIDREIEANEFYGAAAKKSTNPDVKALFSDLALEENGHREILERYRRDPGLTMKISAPAADFKVAEGTEMPVLSIAMKPVDAIALAMKKEQQAVEFYRSLSARTIDPDLKAVLENFANMELGHKHRLENVFVDIGYPEVF